MTLATDPLALSITRDGEEILVAPSFVAIGRVSQVDPTRYYDPAAPPTDVTWDRPAAATAWDDQTRRLALGGDAALVISTDGVLTLESPGAVLLRYVLPLAAGEEIFGTGGREDTPASREVVREMQFRLDLEAESSTNEVHVPVPLAIYPARALGFLVNELRPGAFDVGGDLSLTFAAHALELRTFPGDAFAVLDQHTALTGRPNLPPEWAFAPMQWRNAHTDGAEVLADAQAIRDNDVPGSVVWVDNPWQTGYNTFEFDPARFPDPQQMITDLDALGFRALVWSTPYVNRSGPTAADHDEATTMGYLVVDAAGRPFDWPWQDGPGALVDFTAPGATAWWQERIARATALGIDGFKLDFGEDLVPELGGSATPFRLAAGGTDLLHNYYAFHYQSAYLGALPPEQGFLLTRAGALGSQGVATCIWPGDLDNDFSRHTATHPGGLPAAIAVGLSLSASGFPFYGPDIGGFRGGIPTAESLLRWAEYASLGTIMQLGGGGGQGTSHNPWDTSLYGTEALPIYRTYARLYMDLFPYRYTYAVLASQTGRPFNYAPGMVHPGHPYEDAFYAGPALFAAPVVEEGGSSRTVTLPPGEWIDWWTGERTAGGVEVTVSAPIGTLPLWRKVGGLVPMLLTPVDTLVPTTAPGVISLADPAVPSELRVLVAPVPETRALTLYDGTRLSVLGGATSVTVALTGGTRHDDARFEIDWPAAMPPTSAGLPEVATLAALDACAPPGCWLWDAAVGRATVRLLDAAGERTVTLSR